MKLFGAASVYFGANIINAGIPFFLLPILTRVLSPTDYGTVAMFSVVLSVFGVFTGMSVHGAISVRYFDLSKKELAQYITTCIGILVVSSTLLMGVVLLLHNFISSFSGIRVEWLLIAVLVSSFQFIINLRLSLWQVAGNAWKYGAFQICRTTADAILSLFFVLVMLLAWKGRILGQSAAVIGFGCVAIVWLLADSLLTKSPTWKIYAKDALSFGLPLIPHSIGGLLIIATDRVIINSVLGSQSVGIYMVAVQICIAIGLSTEAFNKAYAPWLFKSLATRDVKIHKTLVLGTYAYIGIIFLLSILYSVLAYSAVPYLVGSEFQSSAQLIPYLAIGFAFGGCYYMVTNYIFFARRTKMLSGITLLCGLVNVPLTWTLTKAMDLQGAAIAFLLTNALFFFLTWIAANQAYPMPWRSYARNNL
jgi:O-antigen/teichoic acid export membrane protein